MTKVASLGECMIELTQAGAGLYARGYGGDTLNTAVYLARLGVDVDYITARGDDPISGEMLAGWAAEGVGTERVLRLSGKLPGIYMIQTDELGERRFFHWRENSAARSLMDLAETDDILDSLATYEVVYLSAITLSIYSPQGRAKLIGAPTSAPGAGPIPTSPAPSLTRRLLHPTLFWLRWRTCCRSIPAKATGGCWSAFAATRRS
jgi:2-dehydro-3-deoxygluconokinase